MFENQIDVLLQNLMTLDIQILAIENQQSTQEVVKCMKEGTQLLSILNEELYVSVFISLLIIRAYHLSRSPDDVEEVMLDLRENMDGVKEINDALTHDVDLGLGEINVEEELELLEKEMEPTYPEVGNHVPVIDVIGIPVVDEKKIEESRKSGRKNFEEMEAMFAM